MALTQGAKIGLIVVIIGCTGYGIMKYRSNVTSALKSASGDTTSVQTKQDTTIQNTTSEIPEPSEKKEVVKDNVVVPVEKQTVHTNHKKQKSTAKPKHNAVQKEQSTQESSKSNNVIPNF